MSLSTLYFPTCTLPTFLAEQAEMKRYEAFIASLSANQVTAIETGPYQSQAAGMKEEAALSDHSVWQSRSGSPLIRRW